MEKAKLKRMMFAALFAALTAAVSWFKIPLPFTPVPITLQTLVVLLSGAMLGAYYGALAMILYITVGALGLPVFAGGGSGFGALLGPTGGYLFSYPLAAFVIGLFTTEYNGQGLKHHTISLIFREISLIIIFTIVSVFAIVSGIFILLMLALYIGIVDLSVLSILENTRLIALLLIALPIFGFLAKKYFSDKKFISLLKYESYFVIIFFVVFIFLDITFKI